MRDLGLALAIGFIAAGVVGVCYTVVLYDRDDRAHEAAMAVKGYCKRYSPPGEGRGYFYFAPCEAKVARESER